MLIIYASSFRSLSLCCYIAGGYTSPDSRSFAEHFDLEFSPLSAAAAPEYQQQLMRSSVSNSNSSVQQPVSPRSTAASSSSGECNIQYWILNGGLHDGQEKLFPSNDTAYVIFCWSV